MSYNQVFRYIINNAFVNLPLKVINNPVHVQANKHVSHNHAHVSCTFVCKMNTVIATYLTFLSAVNETLNV